MTRSMRFSLAIGALALLARCSGSPDVAAVSTGDEPPAWVGRMKCASCHPAETELWVGSHHDLAMQPATPATVLGDFGGVTFDYAGTTTTFFQQDGKFLVRTDGPDGKLDDFEIAYTFGVEPLQQYLVAFEGGRYQALSIAWDSRPESEGGGRWFHLYPDEGVDYRDPLHWTKRFHRWNVMCASCHSTRVRKNYDSASDRYHTEFFEIDVSCESCHGPGSRHVAWAEATDGDRGGDAGLTVDLRADDAEWVMDVESGLSEREPPRTEHVEVETCARCHSRRAQVHEDDPHGQTLLQDYRPALLTEPLYYPDGQIRDEVYVYGSFLQSKMYQKGVTCQDCHDPHGLHVRAEGNGVCASCHLPEKFDTEAHHFHEPSTDGAFCVDCHMPQTTYMVVDPRRDHSFRVPRPDLTATLGAPNACNRCHAGESSAWAAETIAAWYGHEPERHFGEALHAGWVGAPGARDRLARLANDPDVPGIVKASAAVLAPTPAALGSEDPLVRLGALTGADALEPTLRHQLVAPLLADEVRTVRVEAARVLSATPRERLTEEQRMHLDRALEAYRGVQSLNADWPESHMNLGVVHARLGELERAERNYQAALELDPYFARAYVNLADLYRAMGDDEASEAILRRAPEDLDDAGVHHALGLALVRLKRPEAALAELRRAAELMPEEPRYAYVYGVALQGHRDLEKSLRVLREANARHPYDEDILIALVTTHRDLGNVDEALPYARRLAELNPSDPSLRQLVSQLEARAR